jgi:hypothetical protein
MFLMNQFTGLTGLSQEIIPQVRGVDQQVRDVDQQVRDVDQPDPLQETCDSLENWQHKVWVKRLVEPKLHVDRYLCRRRFPVDKGGGIFPVSYGIDRGLAKGRGTAHGPCFSDLPGCVDLR